MFALSVLAALGHLSQRERQGTGVTDSHASDIGHWLGMTGQKQGAGAADDEARTRFPASREWHSHSQEPCLTSEFDALRAGRGSEFKPARGIPKTKPHPVGWGFVFVIAYRFCCPHSRPPQGRGSVRGEPLTGSPTRVQSPARRRPLLRSKSAAPKRKTPVGVSFFLYQCVRITIFS